MKNSAAKRKRLRGSEKQRHDSLMEFRNQMKFGLKGSSLFNTKKKKK